MAAISDAEATAKQRLSQVRAPIQQLADSNIIGIIFGKREGPIIDANDEFLRMVGYSREDLEAGRLDWIKMTPPEWGFATRQAGKQVEEVGKAQPFEKEFFRRDGSRVAVLIGVVALSDSSSDALCYVVDLTERKQAERDLDRLTIERFAMLDSVADGIYGLDTNGQCTFINPAAARMLGYEAEECQGRNMHDLIHFKSPNGEPLPREACPILSAARKCVAIRADAEVFWRKDGTSFVAEYSSCPIVVNGHAEGSVLSFKDISERKKAEENLRLSEERFRGAFAHAAAGMCISDMEGRLLEVNQALCRITGYNEAELLALSAMALSHPDDLHTSDSLIGQLLSKEIPAFVAEKRYIRKDGSIASARCSIAILFDAAGSPARFVTIAEDITEQVEAKLALRQFEERYRSRLENTEEGIRMSGADRGVTENPPLKAMLGHPEGEAHGVFTDGISRQHLEEQLLRAQKMDAASQLTGGMAHDFNNLLTVILGYSSMLERKLAAEDPRMKNVVEIKKAGERAAALTGKLLAFSRKQAARPQAISLNGLIRDMQAILGTIVGEDVELVTRLDPAVLNIQADPAQMEQVILSLAINARDAMRDGGRLLIESQRQDLNGGTGASLLLARALAPGAYAVVTFTDSGCGMDEPTRARIFEPFFTTKEPGVASGLGLSTVLGIINQSGGAISVSSEIGCGATFKIYLPLLDGAASRIRSRQLPAATSNGETILVVEDDDAIRGLARSILEEQGYSVLEAANAEEALRVAGRSPAVDLLLTSAEMGGMNDGELANQLVAITPGMKVLYVSQQGLPDHPDSNLLKKPFQPHELLWKINDVLGKKTVPARVLIVEDDSQVRSLLSSRLESEGYIVVQASNGKEAEARCRETLPDLIITDLVMPEQDGLETITTICEQWPHLPVIAISGAVGGAYLDIAQKLGADVVLRKPFPPDVILKEVRRLTAQ
jgi:PAS domain S-box-containing protein